MTAPLKVALFGATGTVGQGVLLECLDQTAIGEVLAVGRRPTGRTHEKLRELEHADFHDFSALADDFAGLDAAFWCIGIPSAGLTEAQYSEVTHDYTVAAAKVLHEKSPGLTFVFISGAGADETEKGRIMWARVKGRTENDLLAQGFGRTVIFRPGMIRPMRGVRHNVPLYRWSTTLMTPLMPVFRAAGQATSTVELGRAMIAAALGKTVGDPPKVRLESKDINALALLAPGAT